MKRYIQNLIVGFASFALLSSAGAASIAVELDQAEVRLLDGGQISDQQRLVGLEIRLKPGVKTYWRMPGESGLPPVFDFAASQNIASVEVKWPAPSRFQEADGTIFGFKERVIFPFIVTPKNKAEPVTLAVTIDFGLRDTLCLPAKADLANRLLPAGDATDKAEIETFLARVPKSGKVKGAIHPALLSLASDAAMLTLVFASDTPLQDVVLEAAGSWFFGEPNITQDGAGRYRASLPIEQKPKSATLAGLALTITALAEGGTSETPVTLDASGSIR